MSQNYLQYNYDEFTRAKVFPLLNYEKGPQLGQPAPSFPLWELDGSETSLEAIWKQHSFTIIEFGSFT